MKLLRWALLLYTVSLFGSMAMMSVGGVLFLLAFVWYLTKFDFRRDLNTREKAVFRASLMQSAALGLCIALSLLGAVFFPVHYGPENLSVTSPTFFDLKKLWYFVLFFALTISFFKISKADRKQGLKIFFIVYGVLSAYGMLQFFIGFPKYQHIPNFDPFFHATLLYGHHLSVASIWIFPTFLALDYAVKPQGLFKNERIWLSFFAVLGVIALFLGFSRTLWISLPIGLVLWAYLVFSRKQKKQNLGRHVKVLGCTVLLGIVLSAVLYQVPAIRNRVQSPMGVGERQALWSANFDFLKSRPLLGIGFGKTGDHAALYLKAKFPEQERFFVGHAHNVFLEMLSSIGILGFIAWMVWVLARMRESFRISPGTFCAWIVFLINGLTQVNFWEGKVLHVVIWISAFTLSQSTQNSQS